MATEGAPWSGAKRMAMCRAPSWFSLIAPTILLWIRASGQNCEGAIQLLSKHDAGEFVRIGHGAEREGLFHAFAEFRRETVGVAADEDQFAGGAVAQFANPF